MADRGGFFTKTVQKRAGRAKEKILQTFGKSDKTTDEIFDEYVNNFKKQETNANRLHKEIKNYVACVKAMQQASKSLFDTINETYEHDWVGCDQLNIKSQTVEMLWSDFNHKLSDQVLIPLNNYQNQFAEVRKRVDKRGRKLVDYDSSRHTYQSLLGNTKKRDEAKISKAKEQLDDARRLYEILNSELYDELPALYDSRIPFVVSNLQTIFSAEAVFHQELTKVNVELSDIMEDLAEENQKGTYNTRKIHPPPTSPKGSSRARLFQNLRGYNRNQASEGLEEEGDVKETSPADSAESLRSPTKVESETRQYEEIDFKKGDGKDPGLVKVFNPSVPDHNGDIAESGSVQTMESQRYESEEGTNESKHDDDDTDSKSNNIQNEAKRVEELYDIPVGATTDNLPSGVLYRVRSTYRYVAEDEDELSFEIGEIVQVVEYEDPDDQEEGWLLGVKESDGQKGLFPANFTRPI